jgi:hypothetical protein
MTPSSSEAELSFLHLTWQLEVVVLQQVHLIAIYMNQTSVGIPRKGYTSVSLQVNVSITHQTTIFPILEVIPGVSIVGIG